MRTFNLRLASVLLVTTLVFGVGVYFLHGFQMRRNADFYLVQADKAKEEAEIARKKSDKKAERKAIEDQLSNLGWFCRLVPNDPRTLGAMEEFGILRAENIRDSRSFAAAYDTLEVVVRKDPQRIEARKKLIELWIEVKRYNDARPLIEKALANKPDDPAMLTYLGRCQAATDEKKKAKASFLDAIKYSPRELDAYFYLSMILKERPELCDKPGGNEEKPGEGGKEAPKAKVVECTPEAVMAMMMEKNQDSSKAHYYMSLFLLSQKPTKENRKEAFEHAAKSLEMKPDDRDSLFLATKSSLEAENFEQACKYAQQGLDIEKDLDRFRREMYSVLAESEYRMKNTPKALDTLQKAFKETKDPIFLSVQADWLIDAGETEKAKASIKELAKLRFDNRNVEYLRGKIYFRESNWGEARRCFENSRSYFSNRPEQAKLVMYWLGICYGQLGNSDQQKRALQEALNYDPTFEPAFVALNEVNRQSGITNLTLEGTISLIKSTENQRTLKSMIPQAIAMKRGLAKEDQNWKQMEEILDEIQKKFPDLTELPLYRCEILSAQERYADADKMLRDLIRKNPKQTQYWSALTVLLFQQKKLDEVEKLLAQFEKAAGDTVELRLMKANYYLRKDAKDALPKLQSLLEKTEGFDHQQKNILRQNLLLALREIGARKEVAELTKLMSEQDPNNIQFLLLSFDQANEAGDLDSMEKITDDIERIEGNGPFWFTCQAILRIQRVIDGGNRDLLDEALGFLEKAKEKRSSWSKIPYLMGRIYDLKNDTTRALKYYQDSIDMGDIQPLAVLRIVDIFCQQQNIREANSFLQRLERNQVGFSAPLMKRWVELSLHKDVREYATALEKARKVAAAKSENPQDLLWFGRVLNEIDRLTRASNRSPEFEGLVAEQEKAFRRAVELDPNAAEAWLVLITFLVSNDKLSDAENTFDEARKKFTGKEGQLALANCLEVLRKDAQAKEQYELALAADPKDVRTTRVVAEFYLRMSGVNQADRANYIKQAESLLNRVIEGKEVKVKKEDVLWARNKMALIVMTRPGYENVEKARGMIAKNLELDPNSAADRALMARIDAMDPRRSNRDEAIRNYKRLLENQQASDEDRMKLAQLYLGSGDWNNASELLRDLAINSADPKYMSFYIHELLAHGETGDTDVYLHQLQEKWPNHVQTILLQSELMVRNNKAEEALDLMKSFVDRSDAVPGDRGQRMRLMAAAMEDFVQRVIPIDQSVDIERFLRTAEMYLRQYADEHPSSALEVVGFLARQRRFDDAASMLESNWKVADPIAIHQAAMLVTEAGRGSPEVVERVIKILTEAKAQFADHPTIQLAIGDINVGEGQYQQAEEIYRDILKKNPGHTVAMNNLAVLLMVSKKNLQEAEQLINKAISITGPISQMLDTRACVYIALGQADKALADMKDVLADNKTPDALFHQAQVLELMGQDNAAAVIMQEALQMGLSEKRLMTPEIPTFRRLRDKAHALSPIKKNEKTTPRK